MEVKPQSHGTKYCLPSIWPSSWYSTGTLSQFSSLLVSISATITLVLKRAIEYLASRFSGLAALLAPPVIAGLVSASLLTILHMVSGTPEIAKTIAVPLTVATSYAALYNYSLWRIRKA